MMSCAGAFSQEPMQDENTPVSDLRGDGNDSA
jgi:hypothetical protein